MNVFVIPSRYPSNYSPTAGIFFKEQADYLAELSPEVNIGISLWGQNDKKLAITKDFAASWKVLTNFISSDKSTCVNSIRANLVELFTPALNLPRRFKFRNASAIIKANRANIVAFEERYGKVDLIHAHVGFPAGVAAMALSKEYNIPYIITEHMGPFPFEEFLNAKGELLPILKSAYLNANKLIAVSPALAARMSEHGLPQPVYIPNVINENFFTSAPLPPTDRFNFFTLAMLSPEKGISDLLLAIKTLVNSEKQVHFTIGGGGTFLPYYKQAASELQVDQYITWLGEITREEAKEQYQKCHAFVLPSHGETFGVVYAEAIACGRPVVATKCGGPECIVNETNGVFANIKDPADLAHRMSYMINNINSFDPQLIRNKFEKTFSKRAVIPQILNVYQNLN